MKIPWPPRKLRSFTPAAIHFMVGFALAALALSLFVKLTFELHEDFEVHGFDQQIIQWVATLRVSRWNGAAVDITALGSGTLITLFSLIAAVVLLMARDLAATLHLCVAAIGGSLLNQFFKGVIARPRPSEVSPLVEVTGFSYPSGHAMISAVFCLTLAVLASRIFRRIGQRVVIFAMAALVIALVGFSRVYLGVHYPSDVLSGILLGSAWAMSLSAYFAWRYWEEKR